ncbi:DUF397 domain-containing protein [Micromonospora hortensis]|uniref:DUF397 domain-containing protein n=1 Tax=Micromonospora hortensis TaxID=2911209 RepID=UPI001EE7E464|nr:DUF397 domain-containing protein [Micromonospora hortensis]
MRRTDSAVANASAVVRVLPPAAPLVTLRRVDNYAQVRLADSGRDSKDPEGPALVFGPVAWRAFVTEVARRS